MRKFFKALRRREVLRTAGLYVGLAWILIEAASVLLPTFDAPEWVLRAVVIAAIVGFPITIVLAWVYDLSESGIVKQADPTDTYVPPIGGRKMDFVAIGVLSVALVFSVYMNVTTDPAIVEEQEPISVLIADFDNRTGDPVFEGTLEQALSDGIEEASFITAYSRANAQQLAKEITPGIELDAPTARLVSLREGINVILAGSIDTAGNGYVIAVRALDPALEDPRDEFEASAASRDVVLETVASLAIRVRQVLGDTDAEGLEIGETYTASSLEAARAYTLAQEMALRGEDEEARAQYRRAIELDPKFGRAYAGLAISTDRLGRADESRTAWATALSLVDRMTEREKYRTLGVYYGRFSRNYDLAIENFQSLLERYPADDAGRNNLAMSYFSARRFTDALEQEQIALGLYPNRLLYRGNHGFFAMYASEFEIAAESAERLMVDHPEYYPAHQLKAMVAVATSELATAEDTYRSMTAMDEPAASIGVIGLADLAIHQGRFDDAVAMLDVRIAADERADSPLLMSTKYLVLGEALQASGEFARGVSAATTALEHGRGEQVLLPAARMMITAGQLEEAGALAAELAEELEPERRAFAKIIEGEIALSQGRMGDALEAFTDAQELVNNWLVRFDLGRLYVEAGRYPEALRQLELSEASRGEGAAFFLDDLPTVRYITSLPYWLGRAREGMGMTTAAVKSYEAFLALRDQDSPDPLAADARARAGRR